MTDCSVMPLATAVEQVRQLAWATSAEAALPDALISASGLELLRHPWEVTSLREAEIDLPQAPDVTPAISPELPPLLDLADPDQGLTWQERALCAQTDPEAFFPEKGGSTREAKRVCVSCEVRAECLEYALEQDERFGIWGGLSERERRRLKKEAG